MSTLEDLPTNERYWATYILNRSEIGEFCQTPIQEYIALCTEQQNVLGNVYPFTYTSTYHGFQKETITVEVTRGKTDVEERTI